MTAGRVPMPGRPSAASGKTSKPRSASDGTVWMTPTIDSVMLRTSRLREASTPKGTPRTSPKPRPNPDSTRCSRMRCQKRSACTTYSSASESSATPPNIVAATHETAIAMTTALRAAAPGITLVPAYQTMTPPMKISQAPLPIETRAISGAPSRSTSAARPNVHGSTPTMPTPVTSAIGRRIRGVGSKAAISAPAHTATRTTPHTPATMIGSDTPLTMRFARNSTNGIPRQPASVTAAPNAATRSTRRTG